MNYLDEEMPEFWQKNPVLMTWITTIIAIVAVAAALNWYNIWLDQRDQQLPINSAYNTCVMNKYGMTPDEYHNQRNEYPYCSTETIDQDGVKYHKVEGGWQKSE